MKIGLVSDSLGDLPPKEGVRLSVAVLRSAAYFVPG